MRVALANLHFGEEPPITGKGGSGTIFFSGCTLRCSYCQNCQLSRDSLGTEIGIEVCADIFLQLQKRGGENINLVTGTQFIPQIYESVAIARDRGLAIPVLWNSSGYEVLEMMDVLDGFADVFLPDLKTLCPKISRQLFQAPDYPERAAAAVVAMAERSLPILDKQGRLRRGTMVRHLVLPGELEATEAVLRWYCEHLRGRSLISVMFQYIPIHHSSHLPPRGIHHTERDQVMAMLEKLNIEDGFVQELEPGVAWVPDFRRDNPFPDDYSRVIWHWKHGFADDILPT